MILRLIAVFVKIAKMRKKKARGHQKIMLSKKKIFSSNFNPKTPNL